MVLGMYTDKMDLSIAPLMILESDDDDTQQTNRKLEKSEIGNGPMV